MTMCRIVMKEIQETTRTDGQEYGLHETTNEKLPPILSRKRNNAMDDKPDEQDNNVDVCERILRPWITAS